MDELATLCCCSPNASNVFVLLPYLWVKSNTHISIIKWSWSRLVHLNSIKRQREIEREELKHDVYA